MVVEVDEHIYLSGRTALFRFADDESGACSTIGSDDLVLSCLRHKRLVESSTLALVQHIQLCLRALPIKMSLISLLCCISMVLC